MNETKKQLRITYGQTLADLGAANPQIVVVDADMAAGTMTTYFRERFPERFFDVGIAEQNLLGVGVGLCLADFIPFVNTFAWLLTFRAGDVLRTLVSYARTNVKVMAAYGGISGSMDGATHQSITDLAVARSLPNLTVMVASDHHQVRTILPLIADFDGPVYFRLSRAEVNDFHGVDTEFTIGKGCRLKHGGDVTLIATGTILDRVLDAASVLEERGISASVLEIHTLKPLDEELILEDASRSGAVVTCEEHTVIGGLGSAVAELLGEKLPVPMVRVGIRDRYCETGSYEKLLDLYGLSVSDIVSAAELVLKNAS